MALYITVVYNFYEIGYIENDTETIKRERFPTIRLNQILFNYYESHKHIIYIYRIFLGIFLSVLTYIVSSDKNGTIIALILALMLLPIYYCYNHIRNIFNLYLRIPLVMIRFCGYQFLYLDNFNWIIFIASLFIFPVTDFIETASQDRFYQKWAQRCVLRPGIFCYRMYYYFIVNVLFILLYVNEFVSIKLWILFSI
jgi:hypothetical protein